MSVALYMDVHIRRAVTSALRLRSIDVLTVQVGRRFRLPFVHSSRDKRTVLG